LIKHREIRISGRERKLDEDAFIVSKTDKQGKITYGNSIFIDISGYSEEELLGSPHNILRHPDMPRAIFKLLWEKVQRKKEIFAYVKNLAKDGAYYWVFANVTASLDHNSHIIGYYSVRRKPNEKVLPQIEDLYQAMIVEEKKAGMDASLRYLKEFLEQQGMDYDRFINTLQRS
jgi:PAS domain S-box-containing protein